jgi:hypothetical protein
MDLIFENKIYDRCIFCGDYGKEIYRTDFIIYFSEFEFNKGPICRDCFSVNTVRSLAIE